jgi:hypothetical protein
LRPGGAVWAYYQPKPGLIEDEEVLLDGFQSLISDLRLLESSVWFFGYGFSWEHEGPALEYGEEMEPTPIGQALAFLWKAAPPGFRVHPILDRSGVAGDCIAFLGPRRVVEVAVNGHREAEDIALLGEGPERTEAIAFTAAGPQPVLMGSAGGLRSLRIPALSVVIITGDRSPR